MKFRALLFTLLLVSLTLTAVRGQESIPKLLSLSGGGYEDSLVGFTRAAQQRARQLRHAQVKILVIPSTLISSSFSISQPERDNLGVIAEQHRLELETACQDFSGTNALPCTATILPVYIRSEASNPANLAFITQDLSAIFFLDGSATAAMQIIANTPLERTLSDAYERGVLVGGTGAGIDLFATHLLGGYKPGFNAENALAFGAADLFSAPGPRGLLFGLDFSLLQSDIFYTGRLGLLLNALADPQSPNVGLGLDHNAGIELSADGLISQVYGDQTVLILDAETYHAADGAHYRGALNYLSLRNVLVHILEQGANQYDMQRRTFDQNNAPDTLERRFETLRLPSEAGSLYLLSSLTNSWSASTLLTEFVNESGGQQARILHVLVGYADPESAQRQIEEINRSIGLETITLQITPETTPGLEPDFAAYDGILFSVADRQQVLPVKDNLLFLRVAWFNGKPILAANHAAVVLGTTFLRRPANSLASGPSTPVLTRFDPAAQTIEQGLGLIPANLETLLTGRNRWGGLFSLAYNSPGLITLGLADHAALVLHPDQTLVDGENIVVSLDLRYATQGEAGSGLRFANGMLDVFAPGDRMEPQLADMAALPFPAATPVIIYPSATPTTTPTLTATPVPTNTPRIRPPTRTPRPSPTTPASPPPRDPTTSNMLVFFSILMVVVILLGVLINRPRFRPPKA
jgi:cyanophycinase-like exopeptidase